MEFIGQGAFSGVDQVRFFKAGSDTVVEVNLTDATAGVAFFAPTGRHAAGASDNLGKGMWSYEVSGGTTVYLDDQRTFSLATTAYWETHSRKEGEVRVEDVTVRFGFGVDF